MSISAREKVGLAIAALLMVVALAGGPDRLMAYAESDGGCSGAKRLPTPETLEQARAATLCLLNVERAAEGLPALVADARLTLAAQLHSDDMGNRHFYAHGNPDGMGPTARVYAQQLPRYGTTVAENIHWATGHRATPLRIMRDWMDSPGHRKNILRREVTHVGVGIGFVAPEPAHKGRARVYTTEFFGADDAAARDRRAAQRRCQGRSSTGRESADGLGPVPLPKGYWAPAATPATGRDVAGGWGFVGRDGVLQRPVWGRTSPLS